MNGDEHKKFHRRIIYVILLMLIFLFGGATFYNYVEGWRYLDALYFSAITMTTVGYGDLVPQTDFGKIFTIVYVFTSVGTVLYGLSLLASHFVETREEFWLQKLGKIRIKGHTNTFWQKLRNILSYKSEKLVREYNNHIRNKKKIIQQK